jgi:hypothetical protein
MPPIRKRKGHRKLNTHPLNSLSSGVEEKSMKQNLRKIIAVTFVAVTVIFAILNTYTSYTYFTVYKALKNFSITIQEFNLEFLDSSARTVTIVNVHNPSECKFEAMWIVERLTLQGEFILIESLYMYEKHLQVHPMSSVNVTIQAEINNDEKTEWIKEWHDEEWLIEIRVLMNGPLVGDFLYDEWIPVNVTI